MSKPRLLDLFCGAGGAAVGYHRAGFEVVGVDIERQPNYPFEFWRSDALAVLYETDVPSVPWLVPDVAAIHASPPCQRYTTMGQRWAETHEAHPDLIAATRSAMQAAGAPYVIENVAGARSELDHPIQVCGRSLGLGVARHRLFECSFPCMTLECACRGDELPVYGKLDGRRLWTRADGSELRAAKTLKQASRAMDIDWMTWNELREAIPPPYTEHVGGFLMAEVKRRARAVA